MKSIVKQFLLYRYHRPRRLFSTNIVTDVEWYQNRITLWEEEENRQKNNNNNINNNNNNVTTTNNVQQDEDIFKISLYRGKKKRRKEISFDSNESITPNDLKKDAGGDNPIGAICIPMTINDNNNNNNNNNNHPLTLIGMNDTIDNSYDNYNIQLISANDADVDADVDVHVKEAAQTILWHSAAHILGQAAEKVLTKHLLLDNNNINNNNVNVLLCDGPPLVDGSVEGGFFYEMSLPKGMTIREEIFFPELEVEMKKILKEKQQFTKLEVTKEFASKMFSYNQFKIDMLEHIPDNEAITLYRNGPFVDLCRGPHIPMTNQIKQIKLLKTSASHWKSGDTTDNNNSNNNNETISRDDEEHLLQRIYGVAFGTKNGMKSWQKRLDEAKLRDHRKIGVKQELFMFHNTSPGSAFMLPHGTRIYNSLLNMLKKEYKKYKYDEIMTPMIYKHELWNTSGHLQNYREDMYMVVPGVEEEKILNEEQNTNDSNNNNGMGLKPMNCPGHCLIYKHQPRSYRNLPLRVADFSPLHRNEISGALSGLTRLRKFQQDDAHVFCTEEQVKEELKQCLNMVDTVYKRFGFEYRMRLSTRPEKYLGSIELWNEAENALESLLNEQTDLNWTYNHGDGGK